MMGKQNGQIQMKDCVNFNFIYERECFKFCETVSSFV